MALTGTRTYVGFGFGAIQSGLLLYEAFQSGTFGRLVVAEVVPEVLDAVGRALGFYTVNIAHPNWVESATIGPIQIENPSVEEDRQRLIDAIAEADEIGTAVPSIAYYVSDSPGSIHHLLAEGLRKKAATGGARAVVYTAENHNHAAETLEAVVMDVIPAGEREAVRAHVRFLNTVVGKMSGAVTSGEELRTRGLATVTPDNPRAFLVEAFNRILISKIDFDPPFQRGISVFEEKDNLLPFEEVKLYGHNAVHALGAYLAAVRGIPLMPDLRSPPGAVMLMRSAFLEETAAALTRKYAGLDPLFTPEGFRVYIDDLLERLLNPHLGDTVARVGRDPARKLGWDDRLIGTMRLALSQRIEPRRYAFGAAAALATLDRAAFDSDTPAATLLTPLWGAVDPDERDAVLQRLDAARVQLRRWIDLDYPDVELFVKEER